MTRPFSASLFLVQSPSLYKKLNKKILGAGLSSDNLSGVCITLPY